jgi:hypothetical protein
MHRRIATLQSSGGGNRLWDKINAFVFELT